MSIESTIIYNSYYMCFIDHEDSDKMIFAFPLSEILKTIFIFLYRYNFNYIYDGRIMYFSLGCYL